MPHPHNVIIGRNCIVGNNCTIYQDVTLGQNKGIFPVLKDNAIIYAGARIIGKVTIGNNAIIGANSVVTHNVPDNAIVGGISATILSFRSGEDFYY